MELPLEREASDKSAGENPPNEIIKLVRKLRWVGMEEEAERLLKTALLTRTHFLQAVDRIQKMGAESVILSLGTQGAVGAFDHQMIEVIPPRVDAIAPIGAGDALAAAFVWAMERNGDFRDALRWGVASGTASARLPGMRFASLAETEEVYAQVDVRQVE